MGLTSYTPHADNGFSGDNNETAHRHFDQFNVNKKLSIFFGLLLGVLLIQAGLSLALLKNVGAHGVTAAKELAPQTESAILMEYLVAEAHRTTEEAMEGVPGADKETAEFLATARWYVNALLKVAAGKGWI